MELVECRDTDFPDMKITEKFGVEQIRFLTFFLLHSEKSS